MSSLRILMYSREDRGLGRTSRTLAIASALARHIPNCSILVLTDLSIIGRFKFPQNVDYVRLPGLANGNGSHSNGDRLDLDHDSTQEIRRAMTRSTARTFRPDVVIVESDVSSLQSEMQHTLAFVREELPGTRIVWGLPDIVGEPRAVIRDWTRGSVYQLLDQLCDEIWIYGVRRVFDQIREYEYPRAMAQKVVYTGYLRSPLIPPHCIPKDLLRMNPRRPVVLITAGGGACGYPLIDNYLDFLERSRSRAPFQSVIVTGPMMKAREKAAVMERARRLPHVICHGFSKHVLEYLRHSQLVVSGGGYNTICANLTYRKKSIVVPDTMPPQERMLRGRVFDRLGWSGFLAPGELSPHHLGEWVTSSLSNGHHLRPPEAAEHVSLEGLTQVGERVRTLVGTR